MKNDSELQPLLSIPVSGQHKYKVTLLVDDNYIDNFISEKMLAASNFSEVMHFAINGQLALDLILELHSREPDANHLSPDIIFVDLNMPVMNGMQFIREFRKWENSVVKKSKIIVLTSSIHDADQSEVREFDSSILFIRKPLTAEMLNNI